MKPMLFRLFSPLILGVALALGPGGARAQNCAQPPPADCGGVPFAVVDAATGQEVQALCVGQAVRFVPCASRAVSPDLVYYTALPGTNVYPPSCLISPTGASTTYRYTPTAAGPVTISENANTVTSTGVIGTFYTRVLTAYATMPPAFHIDPCPAGSALVTVTDTAYDTYTVQAGNGPVVPIQRNQPQVVALPFGATTVIVTGRYNLAGPCLAPSTQVIPTLAPAQVPALSSLTLNAPLPGGDLALAVGQLPAGYRYTLQRTATGAPGSFQDVADVPPGSTGVAVPAATAGGYRLLRTDYCQTSTAASALRYTLSLTVASARGRNQLLLADANPAPGPYAVTRNGMAVSSVVPVAGGLEDTAVVCGTRYTYRVSADGGAVVSNEASLVTSSNVAPPAPLLVASFNPQNRVVLTPFLAGGPVPAGGSLSYRRQPSGGAASDFITTATGRAVTDSTAASDAAVAAVCYSVRFTDVCGNTSAASRDACPSILTARALDDDATAVGLSWSAFTGPDPARPAAYALQTLAADGTVLATAAPTAALSATDAVPPADRQILRYRLQISGAGLPAGTFSYSNVAPLLRRTRLLLPNAFTPNGDGLNDVFEIKGRFLQIFVLVIVDRNGQQVFRATDRAATWDGTINGHAPVNGVYVWRFEQIDEAGQAVRQTGTVTILK